MRLSEIFVSSFLIGNAAGVLWAYWHIWKRRSITGAEAIFVSMLLLIPLLGFLYFLWLLLAPPPQAKDLMGNMPRGTYTHHMISLKAVLESKEPDPGQNQQDGDEK